MISVPQRGMQPQTLVLVLLSVLRDLQWTPQRLSPDVSDFKELEQLCLDETDILLIEGRADLCLSLISDARRLGLSTPRLEHHRARALAALGQLQEALVLLEKLATDLDQGLATAAKRMLVEPNHPLERLVTVGIGAPPQQPGPQEPTILQDCLLDLCHRYGWSLLHIDPEAADHTLEAVLKEIIALREAGYPDLSFLLVEAARSSGFESGWLRDNQARALIHLGRPAAALALWRELQSDADENLAAAARQMLALYGPETARKATMAEVEARMEAGDPEGAVPLLVKAVIRDGDDGPYREALIQAIGERQGDEEWSRVERELKPQQWWLDAQDVLLDEIELSINRLERCVDLPSGAGG
jgi:tetratricopeptide (TPR) repeat protein